MAAPTNAANLKKALANSEPSTHGTWCRFVATHRFVAIEGIADIRRSLAARRSDANDPNPDLAVQSRCPACRGGNSQPYSEQLLDSLGMAAIASLMASYLSHAPSAEKISAGFGEAALGLGEN